MDMNNFYDQMAPLYHLLFENWETSAYEQGKTLGGLIRTAWGDEVKSVLDVSCGIGTQAIGLSHEGFAVKASDLSPEAVQRAQQEAKKRSLKIDFSVCDMRQAFTHHGGGFDAVVSCDNSVTHLQTDEDIFLALRQMFDCIRPGGGALLTVRDYDREERGKGLMKPYPVREHNGKRYAVFQVWDFEGDHYDFSMFFVEDDRKSEHPQTRVMRSRYYAIGTGRLMELMQEAGFRDVRRIDNVYYQPVLIGTRR